MKQIFFGRLEIEASRLRPKKGLARQGTLQCREVALSRATHYSFDKREWYRQDGTTPSVVGDLIDGYFVEDENLPHPDLEDEIGVYPVRWRGSKSKIEEAKASLAGRLPVVFTPRGVKLTRPLSVEEAEGLFYDPSHEDWVKAGVPLEDIYSGYKRL